MTTPLEKVLAKLPDAKSSGDNQWSARCPAHDDDSPSLSVGVFGNGHVGINCHAGCETKDVLRAMGLTMDDLFAERGESSTQNGKTIVARYAYRDESGAVLMEAVRYEPKDFRQRRPKPEGGWTWKVKGVRIVPYRLPELLASDSATPVYVVEGEKDADALATIGVVATCNAGGAGKWTAEHARHLAGRHVAILPDNDDAGRNHARQVACSLHGVAATVKIVELSGLPDKGDASDWIAAGGTALELSRLFADAPGWTPTAEPWPELLRFDSLDLPAFPIDSLPTPLREWVKAESHATQTPPDLAALLTLAVCGARLARRVEVEPRPGWREPVNLFVSVLLEPGNRKSAVFADATKPLREVEAELIEEERHEVAVAQSERRQDEKRLASLERKAAESGSDEARHDAGVLSAALAEKVDPVLPRLIVDDATSEKLGMMLADQGGRIASMSPEGGVFDLMAGLYSKSGAPQFGVYLIGHSGDDLITDRVGRKGVRVERPALTCAYAIQPAVIKGLAENVAFRGRGLLARFLYAAPRSWIGERMIGPAPVNESTHAAYRRAVRALGDAHDGAVLRLTRDAARGLADWEAEVEAMLGDGGDMEAMRDWGGKLVGATVRLAAVLHSVSRGPTGNIDGGSLAAAVAIARYLIPHAEAVFDLMEAKEDSADADAKYVWRWIERRGGVKFTRSEAQQDGKRRFPKADDIDAALAELERRGYVRQRPAEATKSGRPPSPAYDVNPSAVEQGRPEKRPKYPDNSTVRAIDASLQDIQGASEQAERNERVRVAV